jgi:hypothetical protein
MHYKTVRDASGRLVPNRELFERYGYDYGVPGLCQNSAAELLEALKDFLASLREPWDPAAPDSIVASLSDHLLTKHVGCRLSPAWVRLFEEPGASRSSAHEPDVVGARGGGEKR